MSISFLFSEKKVDTDFTSLKSQIAILLRGECLEERIKGVAAARFLETISQQDGCWAFSSPPAISRCIKKLLAPMEEQLQPPETEKARQKKTRKGVTL